MKPFYSPEEKIAVLEEFAEAAEEELGLRNWTNEDLRTRPANRFALQGLTEMLRLVREACNWPDPGANDKEATT